MTEATITAGGSTGMGEAKATKILQKRKEQRNQQMFKADRKNHKISEGDWKLLDL